MELGLEACGDESEGDLSSLNEGKTFSLSSPMPLMGHASNSPLMRSI